MSASAQTRSVDPHMLGDDFYRALHEREFFLHKGLQETDYHQIRQQAIDQAVDRAFGLAERVIRRGGQNVFGRKFRLRSTVGWGIGKSVHGQVDIGIPVLSFGSNMTLNLQSHFTYWQGHRDMDRMDFGAGLVLRRLLDTKVPLVLGVNSFYDHNVDDGLGRVGIGMDMQSRYVLLAINGYLALSSIWESEGLTDDYERRAVSGAEAKLRINWGRFLATTLTTGYWQKTELKDDEKFGDMALSLRGDMSVYLHPNVALYGQYNHGSYNVDGDGAAAVGLRLQWPRHATAKKLHSPDLYKLVERESRVLYAERKRDNKPQLALLIRSQVSEEAGYMDFDIELNKVLVYETTQNPALNVSLVQELDNSDIVVGNQSGSESLFTARQNVDFVADSRVVPIRRDIQRYRYRLSNVLIDDEEDEPEEEFFMVYEFNADAIALGFEEGQRAVKIVIGASDERPQRLVISSDALEEGDEGEDKSVPIAVRLNLSDYEMENLPEEDYVFEVKRNADDSTANEADVTLPTKVVIPAGSLTGNGTLALIGDNIAEGQEEVAFTLHYPENFPYARHKATARRLEGKFMISDNDMPASLVLVGATDDQSQLDDNRTVRLLEGTQEQYRFMLQRADGVAVAVPEDLRFSLVSRQPSTDYRVSDSVLQIVKGKNVTQVFTIEAIDDVGGLDDVDKTVPMSLALENSNHERRWLNTEALDLTMTLFLIDDDGLPQLRLDNRFVSRTDNNRAQGSLLFTANEPSQSRQTISIAMSLHRPIESADLRFTVSSQSDSAINGQDYMAIEPATLTIPAGKTIPHAQPRVSDAKGNLLLKLLGDDIAEDAEDFSVQFTNFSVSSGTLAELYGGATTISMTVRIAANDAITQLVAVDENGDAQSVVSMAENSGTKTVYYELRNANSAPVKTQQAVSLSLVDTAVVGAPVRDTHYTLSTTSLTIAAGQSRTSTLTIIGIDDTGATAAGLSDRVLRLVATPSLNSPANWYRVSSSGTAINVTIENDDSKRQLRIGGVSYRPDKATETLDVEEGRTLSISLALDAGLAAGFGLSVRSVNGTADTSDYTALNASISFAPNAKTPTPQAGVIDDEGNLLIRATQDRIAEGSESFTVILTPTAVGSTVAAVYDGAATITFTIRLAPSDLVAGLAALDNNGDEITSLSLEEDAGEGTIVYELRDADGAVVLAPQDITINVTTASTTGAPVLNTHYSLSATSLTIAAGQSRTVALTMTGIDDSGRTAQDLADRALTVSATPDAQGADWYSPDPSQTAATAVTLTNDDDKAQLLINGVLHPSTKTTATFSTQEGRTLTIPISLSRGLAGGLNLLVRSADGTADSKDYTSITATVGFAADRTQLGERSNLIDGNSQILVKLAQDNLAEAAEDFTISLTPSVATGILADVYDGPANITLTISIAASDEISNVVIGQIDENGNASRLTDDARISENSGTIRLYFEFVDRNDAPVRVPENLTMTVFLNPLSVSFINPSSNPVINVHYRQSTTSLTTPAGQSRTPAFTITGIDDNGIGPGNDADRIIGLSILPKLLGSPDWISTNFASVSTAELYGVILVNDD